jgi:hypothetical protein
MATTVEIMVADSSWAGTITMGTTEGIISPETASGAVDSAVDIEGVDSTVEAAFMVVAEVTGEGMAVAVGADSVGCKLT